MKRIIYVFFIGILLLDSCANKTRTTSSSPAKADAANLPAPRRAEILFLGNTSKHHDSGKYAPWLAIELFKSGINVTYTTELNDLNPANLAKYDGLVIYANHDVISPSQESALKDFVEGGKGLIPLHSASGCFKNSEWYIKAVGGQFLSHKMGPFTATITNKNHPVTRDLTEFQTTDETYVHQKLNPDMTVLMERMEDGKREPYTWVRNQGKGRVFYTAYGHDDVTWKKLGFLKLVSNGVLWAIGDQVRDQVERLKVPNVSIYADTIADFTARHLVPKVQPALTPEESIKLIQVPPDFEIRLFAAEPDITNPIAMSWDERGRLWIVESVDYPNTFLETDGAANDRIKICEDTNGDGKADKFTIFADKLNIPTSMVFANGGVIVSMAPYFVFLKDTNGDDKADIRENILTGWEKADTHFGPSNLQYGFNNKIWGVVGSSFTGTAKEDGKPINFRGGVYNVNVDGTGLDFLGNTSNNTWGLGFSEDNNVFISTANNTHAAYYSMHRKFMQRGFSGTTVLPVQKIDGHYDAHAMTPNLRQVDVVGGFTAAAGSHLYTARNFPREYWNRISLVCEPTMRLLHRAVIEPDGAGFTEKDGWNLLASNDEWVGPVQAEVGPDGAVWVSDWYNFIIQHNVFVERQAPSLMVLPFTEQPRGQGNAFSSPLRDIDYGRIYRIVYKKGKSYTAPKLSKNDIPGLVSALNNDNMFWRMTAQRLLVEAKDLSAVTGLINIIGNQSVDSIGLNSPAVHALWTLHGLGALNGANAAALQAATAALAHPAAGVRKAAAEVLPKTQTTEDIFLRNGLLNDPNLNTRLSVFLAVAEMPASEAMGRKLYEASLKPENGKDEWLSRALFAASIAHSEGFMAAAPKPQGDNVVSSDVMSLSERIAKALTNEVYDLGGRNLVMSPNVARKEFTIKANINRRGPDPVQGVIAAQGGILGGYGIYIQDGKLFMTVKQDGRSYTAATSAPLPDRFALAASFAGNGQMTVLIDGKEAASAKAPSLFTQPLVQPLRTTADLDDDNRMGPYTGQFRLRGDMQRATIELKKPVAAVVTPPQTAPKKTSPAKTKTPAKPAAGTAVTKPAAAATGPATVTIRVVKEMMQYDKKLFTVKAGQKVTINFENPDGMQHNMVIIKPGTLPKLGAAADAMLTDPKASAKSYIPSIPEVLFSIKLLDPGDDFQLTFTVPATPGDYPFVCTFPGHWRGMNGIMRVVK
ncbi:PVC-type heme-binding CxxCH protein [Hufsiella ginkgonis]|uniref:Dehydrogenase n=1 Tax=Hufsiella ginkgonis TaxID=2695274 RepID=A0A7K1XZH2_9SPHI|nr:PVC-type heme-binding CxxCH protein [Hufsiella ginkgonis]MXV16370.1 dehydrogenase [Hufsiella ginkgonis]